MTLIFHRLDELNSSKFLLHTDTDTQTQSLRPIVEVALCVCDTHPFCMCAGFGAGSAGAMTVDGNFRAASISWQVIEGNTVS